LAYTTGLGYRPTCDMFSLICNGHCEIQEALAVAVIADRTAYDVRYTGKLLIKPFSVTSWRTAGTLLRYCGRERTVAPWCVVVRSANTQGLFAANCRSTIKTIKLS